MSKLTTEQQQSVKQWAEEGASLNEIQDRLKNEFSIALTYLDTRLLVSELGVALKKPKKEIAAEAAAADEIAKATKAAEPSGAVLTPPDAPAGAGKVSLTIDPAPIPNAMASGKATFSDGKSAVWYLDQNGSLGMQAPEPGYQPPAADIPVFQEQLEIALQQAGF